jgi:hypothetical protein
MMVMSNETMEIFKVGGVDDTFSQGSGPFPFFKERCCSSTWSG